MTKTKSVVVATRVSFPHAEMMKDRARAEGLSFSDWLRQAAVQQARKEALDEIERQYAEPATAA